MSGNLKRRVAGLPSSVRYRRFVILVTNMEAEAIMNDYDATKKFAQIKHGLKRAVRTFRMWLIGIFLTVTSVVVNTIFDFRNPRIFTYSCDRVYCVFSETTPWNT
jgi:hypothetical protein